MTVELTKPVSRKTALRIQRRNIVLTLEPGIGGEPDGVSVRLAGTRDAYRIDAESLYSFAVKIFINDVERRARQIRKSEGVTMRSAKAKARKELQKKLRLRTDGNGY